VKCLGCAPKEPSKPSERHQPFSTNFGMRSEVLQKNR